MLHPPLINYKGQKDYIQFLPINHIFFIKFQNRKQISLKHFDSLNLQSTWNHESVLSSKLLWYYKQTNSDSTLLWRALKFNRIQQKRMLWRHWHPVAFNYLLWKHKWTTKRKCWHSNAIVLFQPSKFVVWIKGDFYLGSLWYANIW